ncbi:MAG TPA: glycerol-3-phosphate dehydrogenase/oxidase [Acidimicrobiales bacterium]|nr:glycerol-3-phosphate dehydrogenase/oxidase [Acidimicrobiales bacterium]
MTDASVDRRFDRATALDRLATETFDVLVVGAGVTGAGVALDAASRGLHTALVEQRDFAYGTSSKSSKMVHGGIRYLQQGDVKLVWQALRERRNLLKNAPHLVRPLGFMIPIFTKGGLIPRFLAGLFRIVLFGYDLVGGAAIVGRHKRLTADEALAYMPTLKRDRLHSALLYYDARTDDARLTLGIVRTAVDHGAVAANYAKVTEFLKNERGKAVGARVDVGGRTIGVSARCVVNAAGVWFDETAAADVGPGQETMRPARGVHMTVPQSLLQNRDVAVILAASGGPGSVFAVPWGDFVYVGTTDTDFAGPLDDLHVFATDVDILLEHINPSLTQPLSSDAVLGSWAGLRPLLRGASDAKTADLSRRHRITRSPSDVVGIAGGKLTTYRRMAQDTVDEVLKVLGKSARCRTRSLALHGSPGQERVDDEHLRHRYGADAAAVEALVADDPSLGEPLVPGQPYLRAEALYAARSEMVVELDDVFSRRTRARLFARDATADVAEDVAALVAGPLGWSPEEQAGQVERYRASVAAEREAVHSPAPDYGTRRVSEGWAPSVRVPRSLSS